METLLKHQDAPHTTDNHDLSDADPHIYIANRSNGPLAMKNAHDRLQADGIGVNIGGFGDSEMCNLVEAPMEDISVGWDMMSLGVEEPLPTPEIQEILYVNLHPSHCTRDANEFLDIISSLRRYILRCL